MVDEHVSKRAITEEEIKETEISTRGQNQNLIWFKKRKLVLTGAKFENRPKHKWNRETN